MPVVGGQVGFLPPEARRAAHSQRGDGCADSGQPVVMCWSLSLYHFLPVSAYSRMGKRISSSHQQDRLASISVCWKGFSGVIAPPPSL